MLGSRFMLLLLRGTLKTIIGEFAWRFKNTVNVQAGHFYLSISTNLLSMLAFNFKALKAMTDFRGKFAECGIASTATSFFMPVKF